MLEAAVETAQGGPLVCVMGEMGELGDVAEEEHEQLGRLLAAALPRAVFFFFFHREAVCGGLEREHYLGKFFPVDGTEDFCRALESLNLSGGVVLFKGSRSNRLEEFVTVFENRELLHAV
jgi:UDP-N-acetylmuramoyl-tripeptide--D-alanyl-D-alanine ligase